MSGLYALIGIFVFWIVVILAVAMWEKRMVWPYSAPEPTPPYPDPTGYGSRSVTEAMQAGFELVGYSRDLKGEKYKVTYALLIAPQRDCVSIVGVGTIFGLPLACTWMISQSSDGRVFTSTDNQAGINTDVSRVWKDNLVQRRGFCYLWQKHTDWVRRRASMPRPFEVGQEFAEYRRLREEHFRDLNRAGLIAFTDPSTGTWRHTLAGAFRYSTMSYTIGLMRAIGRGEFG